ncbi:MAG: hypothetical protein COV31_01470 [Candidatus Yanofskybacteria bacterium CG10_big_fil_rev_8_21_14_0_10_46_23]|uniref:HD domain-containing protein n=1 Tax=Candidatus Yanofskybacteria bacterium CG10_big_fil_rev_8_21_14_0_10_46_23 TaxID=1975098 RepID=A0A2H0R4F5_9BACT|nr:MAG: hypothetical protein COV31_01470 [Candidatus Yanofskybacteria bacterium CG10_big_fil_rev_8_21_14_0_10_46_23]
MELLRETGLLAFIIPELEEGIGIDQNKNHIYTVWEHLVNALKYASEQNFSTEIRLAALFHDIGKPRSKRGEGKEATFYGHEVIGARMVKKILERLKFPKKQTEKIVNLVRQHQFYYSVDEVTESSVRRLLAKVGKENFDDLIKLREADRIGMGRPKAKPYKLRHLEFIAEKVSRDPISVGMLELDGDKLMKILDLKPGPRVGLILRGLFAQVLDDPSLNTPERLTELAKELNKVNDADLAKAADRIKTEVEREETELKDKYYVK